MVDKIIDEFDIKQHLQWVIPTIVTVFVIGYHLMYAVHAVSRLEDRLDSQAERIRHLESINYDQEQRYRVKGTLLEREVKYIQEFCCSELKKAQQSGTEFAPLRFNNTE